MRTGSCWMHTLIADNFKEKALSNALQWKHGFPLNPTSDDCNDLDLKRELANDLSSDKILFLMIIKNPYSWILSMCKRRRWNVNSIAHDFLQELTLKWNAFALEYIGQQRSTYQLLKYEQLLSDTEDILDFLSDFLTPIHSEYKVCKREVTSNLTQKGIKDWSAELDKGKTTIKEPALKVINDILDKKAMCYLSYEFV